MATSGSFNTNTIGDFYLKFSWRRTSTSTSNNTSTISWELTAHNAAGLYRTVYNRSLTVDGANVHSSSSQTTAYEGTVLASGTRTITHNNDGTKSFSANVSAGIGQTSTNCTGNGTWTLDAIPRHATINSFTLDNRTINTFRINYTMSNTCDRVEYRIDGGAWTLAQTGDRTSGNFTVTGRNRNTEYRVNIRVRRKDSQLWTESGNQSITTSS